MKEWEDEDDVQEMGFSIDPGLSYADVPLIGRTLEQEARLWETHVKLGIPFRSLGVRQHCFLALCSDAGIRASALQLVTAFRCGYWAAAGNPVPNYSDLAQALQVRKQTWCRLVALAIEAWGNVPRDDSFRVYPEYAFGAFPEQTGTHTESEGIDWLNANDCDNYGWK